MRVLWVCYDNDAYTHWFPQGLGYITAVLEKAGHEIEIYNQDIHHWPDDHLREYLDENVFDVIGVSLIAGYYQYKKLKGISAAINASKNRPIYMLGGYRPGAGPEFFLRKMQADFVVVGEGEETSVELFDALENKRPVGDIQGIAFREGDEVTVNPRRPLIADVDSIPFPAFHKFNMEYYRMVRQPNVGLTDFVMPVMSGRGCTFKCTFCFRLDTGHRARSNDAILAEVELLQRDYGINFIQLSDDLLMTSRQRTEDWCNAIIKSGMKFRWSCNGRINYVDRPLLKLMKKAGCAFVNYGIESMDNEVLRNMKKGLRKEMVEPVVKMTLEEGLSPGLNIIFGNVGDTPESLEEGTNFLLKYVDGCQMRTIRPVTPYPGSPLFDTAVERGLLKDIEDFYENKHLNSDLIAVNFTDIPDDEFHELLRQSNRKLVKRYYEIQTEKCLEATDNLYKNHDVQFRGYRGM